MTGEVFLSYMYLYYLLINDQLTESTFVGESCAKDLETVALKPQDIIMVHRYHHPYYHHHKCTHVSFYSDFDVDADHFRLDKLLKTCFTFIYIFKRICILSFVFSLECPFSGMSIQMECLPSESFTYIKYSSLGGSFWLEES